MLEEAFYKVNLLKRRLTKTLKLSLKNNLEALIFIAYVGIFEPSLLGCLNALDRVFECPPPFFSLF